MAKIYLGVVEGFVDFGRECGGKLVHK